MELHRIRRAIGRLVIACAVGFCVGGTARGAIVETGYSGTIDEIDATLAAALPPESPIQIGASIVVNYAYESTTADTDASSTSGIYTGAITSFTLYVGDQVFVHDPNGPVNEIDVLVEPILNLYQPVDSVTADPPLPIVANLEGDVIFIAANESPLVDDSLIEPPTPGDPGWASAEAAITDDARNKLINAVLSAQCAGGCPVPNGNTPVPMAPPLFVAAALALAGASMLRRS